MFHGLRMWDRNVARHSLPAPVKGEGIGQVVSGEEERAALRGLGAHRLPEGAAGQRIHAGSRLVEDQEVRIAGQCEGEAHTLTLTSRELVDWTFGQFGELCAFKEFVGGDRIGMH